MVSHSKSVLIEILFHKNDFNTSIESKLNTILSKAITCILSILLILEVITNKLEFLLGKQKKSDFKPKEDILSLEGDVTPVIDFL